MPKVPSGFTAPPIRKTDPSGCGTNAAGYTAPGGQIRGTFVAPDGPQRVTISAILIFPFSVTFHVCVALPPAAVAGVLVNVGVVGIVVPPPPPHPARIFVETNITIRRDFHRVQVMRGASGLSVRQVAYPTPNLKNEASLVAQASACVLGFLFSANSALFLCEPCVKSDSSLSPLHAIRFLPPNLLHWNRNEPLPHPPRT